jgi:uncharacterized protein involved in type VI secretion and phage assembly
MSDGLSPALVLGEVIEVQSDIEGHKVRLQRLDLPAGVETDWISVATPMAGDKAGFLWTPKANAGDIAVVAFAGRRPIVLGFVFAGGQTPPTTKPEEHILQSRDENRLVLIDGDASGIQLKDKHGNEIRMDKDGITLKSAKKILVEASDTTTVKGATVELNP